MSKSWTRTKTGFRFDGTDGQLITDGAEWKSIAQTRYHHNKSRLATYKVSFSPVKPRNFSIVSTAKARTYSLFQGKPFIVGSRGLNDNKHTEAFENSAWTKLRDYPYGAYLQGGISAYATASTKTAAYIIGGFEHAIGVSGSAMRTVAKYENDTWTKLGGPTGGLTSTRYGHNAIWAEDELFIIGGHQTK